ncbi:MAG: ATP-binding cassette domain-containing protein [Methylovirgula sp.]
MISDILLKFDGLGASYGNRSVFDSASLALPAGLHALQGSNGLGKSTLLRLLAGAQLPDHGQIWINGASLTRSPQVARRALSYVPDETPIYPFMTGSDFLRFVAAVKKADLDATISNLINNFDLNPHLDTRFDAMSLGTQKKMLLCAAFIGAPKVLLVDEPSNGLDHASRGCLIGLFRAWRDRSAILFTTHDGDFITETGATPIMLKEVFSPRATKQDQAV